MFHHEHHTYDEFVRRFPCGISQASVCPTTEWLAPKLGILNLILVLKKVNKKNKCEYHVIPSPRRAVPSQFLYEHPEAASGDPTLVDLAFKRWIDVPSDLRMIGVGEPGVKLNLRTLTSSLRSRYLRTQTVLYPVVEKIRTFATVHTFYLDYLQVRC